MANTKAENAVRSMGLGSKFYMDSVVQMNLISSNPEDAYELFGDGFDLIMAINLQTGKEIEYTVCWMEAESSSLVSNLDEEEVYIDMLQDRKETIDQIWIVDSPALLNGKTLFTVENYSVVECCGDRTSYYLVNSENDRVYEMLLETCFGLMTRYLDEDQRYILHEMLVQLELNAVN